MFLINNNCICIYLPNIGLRRTQLNKLTKPDDEKTTEIFVKVLNGDCISILEECLSSYEYEIVKKYDMTEIYLLKFDSVEYADNAINLLNARQDIKFAEPNYVLKAK